MDVFPALLGENELRFFTDEDFVNLGRVLNDSLAQYIKDYIYNDSADPEVVKTIVEKLGPTIESLTFHYVIKDLGIVDLISKIIPETLLSSDINLTKIRSDLTFLESHMDQLRIHIQPRTKDDYKDFLGTISKVLARQRAAGVTPTYPNIRQRIETNSYVFYIPSAKPTSTGCSIVNSRYRSWIACLRGLEYNDYCNDNGIDYFKRRVF